MALTEQDLKRKQDLKEERAAINKELDLLEFRKDNYTLADITNLSIDHLNLMYKKVNIGMVSESEYNKMGDNKDWDSDSIHCYIPEHQKLKSVLGDGKYIVATRIKTIEFEYNERTEEIILWVIVRDA